MLEKENLDKYSWCNNYNGLRLSKRSIKKLKPIYFIFNTYIYYNITYYTNYENHFKKLTML